MKIQVLKNEVYQDVEDLPKKGTDRATGYDIVTTSEPEIVGETTDNITYTRVDYIQYKTNLKLAVQKEREFSNFGYTDIDHDVLAFPRSSVSKYNLVLANCIGLIDADYRGEVLLRFKYQWQPEDYRIRIDNLIEGIVNSNKLYKKGDKVCQLKVTKVENVEFVLVNELDSTNRGEGGFGSTDDKKGERVEIAQLQMSKMEALYNSLGGIPTPNKKYSQLVSERDTKQFNQ
jgi:dUTP pyrophosphatase